MSYRGEVARYILRRPLESLFIFLDIFILSFHFTDSSSPPAAATVEIIPPETPLITYKQTATVACKVTGSPTPSIWWEDESGRQMNAEVIAFLGSFDNYRNIIYIMLG